METFCDHENGTSVSIRDGNFLDQGLLALSEGLCSTQLLKLQFKMQAQTATVCPQC